MKRRSLFLLMAALVLGVFGCALPQSGETPAAPEEGVVRIGDTAYTTIHDAVEHAGNGDTLVLLKDIEIDRTVEIQGKEITLIPEGNRTILRCPTFREELFYIAVDGRLQLEGQKGELIIDGNGEKAKEALFQCETSLPPGPRLYQRSKNTLKEKGIHSIIKNEGVLSIKKKVILCNNIALFQSGGAVWNNGEFILDRGVIQNNEADYGGGGIYNEEKGKLTIKSGKILKNKINFKPAMLLTYTRFDEGGGINNSGLCILKGGVITENVATEGGGVINYGNGKIIISNAQISNNEGIFGGGIYNTGNGILKILGGDIIYNKATDAGGGIFNSENGKIRISNGRINYNTARRLGGGISNYTQSNLLEITGGTVFSNEAQVNGGGIFFLNETGLFILDEKTVRLTNNKPNNLSENRNLLGMNCGCILM